mmetsp:Transcript_20454/g.30170  ORF Transcript_20454/g.30170 Transcript_20454/m.30170 type:complete len:144 (+) Transcript_20454:77-508(+)
MGLLGDYASSDEEDEGEVKSGAAASQVASAAAVSGITASAAAAAAEASAAAAVKIAAAAGAGKCPEGSSDSEEEESESEEPASKKLRRGDNSLPSPALSGLPGLLRSGQKAQTEISSKAVVVTQFIPAQLRAKGKVVSVVTEE